MKKLMMISAVVLMSIAASAQTAAPAPAPAVGAPKGHVAKGADAQNIDKMCAADAAADKANCGTEQVGTGLIKCLHAYIKSGKSVSPDCASALAKAKEDHKVKKAHH